MIKVPNNCLICGAERKGGSQLPNKPFPKTGVRVFYMCGASMSIKEMGKPGQATWYIILFKNCFNDKENK